MLAYPYPYRSVMAGFGSFLPERIVTNDELSGIVDTNHEWIVERTGIHQRHFAAPGQLTSDLATNAGRLALEMAGINADDLDLIVVGTATPDLTFPSTGTIVQHKLGNTRGLAFDVSAVCSGYLLALNVADNWIKTGQAKTALVIGAETFSRLLDMTDRRTCVLFGDGAGAVVLRAEKAGDTDRGVLGVHLYSDGSHKDLLYADGGVSSTGTRGSVRMVGKEVFRHAVSKLARAAEEVLSLYEIAPEQIDWLIPHQANLRIIEGMARKLNMPMERVITTVQKHGNTSAASIPMALDEAVRSGKVKPGQYILHEAIGGGLVWGAGLVRF